MSEEMTAKRAYEILDVPFGSDFSTTAKAYRVLRDKYDPAVNPHKRKEYTEALAAFEFLQRGF